MKKLKPLSKTDLEDILNGAALLGSGGGGPLSVGKQLIANILSFPQLKNGPTNRI